MGMKKTKLIGCESIYWPVIDSDIEKYIKSCSTCLGCQQTQSKE